MKSFNEWLKERDDNFNEVLGFGSPQYPDKPGLIQRAIHPVAKTIHGAMGGRPGKLGDLVRDTHAGSQFRQNFETGLNTIASLYSQNNPKAASDEQRFLKTYANHPDAVGSGYGDVKPMSAEEISAEIQNRAKKIKSGTNAGSLSQSHNRFTGEKFGGGATLGGRY